MTSGVELGWALASLALSAYLAKQVAKKQPIKKLKNEPTTLTQRGSALPWISGNSQIGPIVCWAGKRTTKQEKINAAGKGLGSGAGSETTVFLEEAVHALCLNNERVRSLRRVIQSGEVIAEGPFTPETHPTGSEIICDVDGVNEGTFEIRWGLLSDPVDEWAGDPDRVGVESSFARIVRLNWKPKRLGQTANWPVLKYDVEVEPFDPTISLNPNEAWFEGGEAEKDLPLPILATVQENLPTDPFGELWIDGHFTDAFLFSGNKVRVDGQPSLGEDTEFTIVAVSFETASSVGLPTQDTAFPPWDTGSGNNVLWPPDYPVTVLQVIEDPISVLSSTVLTIQNTGTTGTTTVTLPGGDFFVIVEALGAANAAHTIAQALFATPPLGLAMDPSRWRLQSFVELSDLMISEQYKCSVTAEQFVPLRDVINELLIDIGCFITLNSTSGLLELVPLRPNLLNNVTIPEAAIQGRPLEIENIISPNRDSRVVYSFEDAALNYKNREIVISDDGIVVLGGVAGGTQVDITTTTDFITASLIALRREQESFGDSISGKLRIGFDGRSLRPGDLLTVPGLQGKVLIMETQLKQDQTGAEHKVASDGYLAPPTPLVLTAQGEFATPVEKMEIGQAILWDVPAQIANSSQAAVLSLLWTRQTSQVSNAILYLSSDGASFTSFSSSNLWKTGGELDGSLSTVDAEGSPISPGGFDNTQPLFTISGPDIDTVLDLSGAQGAFQAGAQLLIVQHPTTGAQEVMALQKVETISLTQARLVGLLRGLYGTGVGTFPPGSEVFIVQSGTWSELTDSALIQSGVSVYFKVQAVGIGSTVPIQDLPNQTTTPA